MSESSQISAQAAAWISRLNADDRSAAVDAACREWLAADPRHRAAFEVANRMWEDASTLPISLAARIGRRDLVADELGPLRERRRGSRPWLAVAALVLAVSGGMIWHAKRPQVLETKTGQQLTVPLDDGSRLILNTDTRVRLRFDKRVRQVDLESGEAMFDVAKDPARPFRVRVGDRQVTALGTLFVVRYDDQQTAVTLVDGKVSVSGQGATAATPAEPVKQNAGGAREEATILQSGERVTFVQRTQLTSIDRPVIDTVTAWKTGQIVFQNTPLATAVVEMNRYSVRKLRLVSPASAQMPVSGLFRLGDVENFVLALTTTHPLTAIEQADEIEIRKR